MTVQGIDKMKAGERRAPDVRTFLAQAGALMQVRRYSEAEAAALRALVLEPANPEAHVTLAWARYYQGHYSAALTEAQTAVRLVPTEAAYHALLARIYGALRRNAEAEKSIREALRLDPERAEYYAVLANLCSYRNAWPEVLRAAEAGLRLAPDYTPCLNLRAMALLRLGRRTEAIQVLETSLAGEPNNALTHTHRGWQMLHTGDVKQALIHFREALRLDPGLEWARDGIVEALRARNPIYRWLLRYSLWMSGFTEGEVWSMAMGLETVRLALHEVAHMFPPLWLLVWPLDVLFQGFITLRWAGSALFTLLVRFDKLGRYAVSRDEVAASNALLACLLTIGLSLGLGVALQQAAFAAPFLLACLMIVPVCGVFRAGPKTLTRTVMAVYAGGMGVLGLGISALVLTGTIWGAVLGLGLGVLFLVARMLYFWLMLALFYIERLRN